MKPNAITRAEVKRAARIAHADLHACETDIGIIAGPHHFVDLWARDSLFATFGLYEKKDFPVFRQTIDTFLKFQRADGLVPYRVMRSKSNLAKYFGKPTLRNTPDANFYSHMSLGLVPDGGLMAIISSAEYVRRSNDTTWLKSQFPSLKRAMDWYLKKFEHSLISEWFQCEWADGILKSGKTLYTNVLYVKALKDMVNLSKKIDKKDEFLKYSEQSNAIYKKFHKEFWNGSYFIDFIDWKRQKYFASHANLLSVIFSIATKKEAYSILNIAKSHCLNTFTLHNVYPSYPFWRTPLPQLLGGIPQYHNRGILWLQPGITYALALHSAGKDREAKAFVSQIGAHILTHKTVYEVYELDGTPVNRSIYKSEGPFAWSAGLFLWAIHEIFGPQKS